METNSYIFKSNNKLSDFNSYQKIEDADDKLKELREKLTPKTNEYLTISTVF